MPNDRPTRRFRFTLKQLFLAVTLVAIGMGSWRWLTRKEAVVRAAGPEDEVSEYYRGTRPPYERLMVRNILVVTGQFTNSHLLSASLFAIRSGVIKQISEDAIGRWWHQGPRSQIETIRLAFGEADSTSGRVTYLFGSLIPASRTYGVFNGVENNINIVAKETLPGTIRPGRPYIVYVEGDQLINVDGKMTLEEFAKANPGNYLVVTVEVR